MPRRSLRRIGPLVWHVMNRAIQGLTLFEHPNEYEAFLAILAPAVRDHHIELFAVLRDAQPFPSRRTRRPALSFRTSCRA